jgi:uncharacterized membrane protein YdfJ with MMPL/SSD domain
MPIMLFALIFGLSRDYEVFLVSRMREQYDKRGDSTEAVATGLGSIGRLVVSAAVADVRAAGGDRTDEPTDEPADKPLPVGVGRHLRAGCR